MLRLFMIAALLLSTPALPTGAQDNPGRQQFLDWSRTAQHPISAATARLSSTDLAPLRWMIGGATIVGLSEGVHAGIEPLEFRNRVFQYLVEEMGFTAIAIESGATEGQVVHHYVLGGPGNLKSVMAEGFSWTFDRFPQNEALVRWIREHNAGSGSRRKINFYGFDLPGSPGNPDANRGLSTALNAALRYLDAVDARAAAAVRSRTDRYLGLIRFNPAPNSGPQYTSLPQSERDRLTSTIADLVAMLERRQAAYIAKSSAQAYQWGYRHAIGARQADAWLRQTPVDSTPSAAPSETRAADDWRFEAGDVRDRAMADNIGWIIEQEGPAGKILVFAARAHLATVPLHRRGQPNDVQKATLGTYLKRTYGDRLVSIGNLVGGGAIGCGKIQMVLPAVGPTSVASQLASRGPPEFLLDLRAAPAAVRTWLGGPNDLWDDFGPLKPLAGRAFDILYFTRAVTPACPP